MAKLRESIRARTPTPQIETLHVGQARNWFMDALPGPVTGLFCLVLSGSVAGLAYFLGDRLDQGRGYVWSLVAIGIMTALVAGAACLAGWQQRRARRQNSAAFHGGLKRSARGLDPAAGSGEQAAAADLLREKFQVGLDVFDKYGKDLYELPWYVMIGGSGAGKTEAIRHGGLRPSPKLHDKLQGSGGTQSMDWWFLQDAVVLDTAGALLTEPAQAARFEEFLELLREYRTDFPINGMIVALSIPALLTDQPADAQDKAGKLADQLALIQKALDVRFPLYLMVSMSDRLPGFTEFCDAEGQSPFGSQMIGWSNPDPLGTPFDPARMKEALGRVGERVRARALALLADPVPREEGGSRLDEVTGLYSLSDTIRALEPGLRCYLDALFPEETWASKSPFFRGLYFTSALRKGGQIDPAFAEAMQVDVDQTIPGGIATEHKAFFLRDFFLSKVFPERGLVTRLRNVAGLLRQRLVVYYGVVCLILAVALLGTLAVRDRLARQLAEEQAPWFKANTTWDNGTLLSPLARQPGGRDAPPRWVWAAGDDRLAQLDKIVRFTSQPLHLGWVFTPVGEWRDFERRRSTTGPAIFESSVMKPLLDATRERVFWDTAKNARRDAANLERLAHAYEQLVRLEVWCTPPADGAARRVEPKEWQTFFGDLLPYVLGVPRDDGLTANGDRMAALAADKAVYADGRVLPSRSWLAENAPGAGESALCHAAGLLFNDVASQSAAGAKQREETVGNDRALLEHFNAARSRALALSEERPEPLRDRVEAECMRPMREALNNHGRLLGIDSSAGPSPEPTVLIRAAATTLEALPQLPTDTPLRSFQRRASEVAGMHNTGPGVTGGDAAWTTASRRLEEYNKAFAEQQPDQLPLQFQDMIGNLKRALEYIADAGKTAEPPAADKGGGQDSEDQKINRFLGRYRGVTVASVVLQKYQKDLKTYLGKHLRFPLVKSDTPARDLTEMAEDCRALEQVEADAASLKAAVITPNLAVSESEDLRRTFTNLQKVFDVKKVLLTPHALSIVVGGVPAAPVRTETSTETVRGGLFAPPAIIPHTNTVQLDGVLSIAIIIAGVPQFNSAPTGAKISVDYDGFSSVEVNVSYSQAGVVINEPLTFKRGEGWSLLRETAADKRLFKVGDSKPGNPKVVVGLTAAPSLPFGHWPTRAMFGLPD